MILYQFNIPGIYFSQQRFHPLLYVDLIEEFVFVFSGSENAVQFLSTVSVILSARFEVRILNKKTKKRQLIIIRTQQ